MRLVLLSLCLALVAASTVDVLSARAQVPGSDLILQCHSFARAPYLCDAVGGCNRDLKLGRIRMDAASRCLHRLQECDMLAVTGSPKADSCPGRGAAHCIRGQAKADTWVSQSAPEQRQRVVDRCLPIDLQDEFLGSAPLGLGIGANAAMCSTLGVPLDSVPGYTACGDIHATRVHAQLLSLIVPRSRELLEDNGWCALFPEEGVTPTMCNTALAPRVAAGAVPTARVSSLRRCQKRIARSYRKAITRDLNYLENCTEEYFKCNVKDAHGDISETGLEGCLDRARSTCERVRDRRDKQLPRVVDSVKRSCADVPFADATDVLGFADVAAECNASTVDEIADCLPGKIRCLAWDLAQFAEPRILDDSPAEFLGDYAPCDN
jgi:hypothetical protein